MSGTLYLCATPIGNLGDITGRVLETLSSVDLIAAEDTRGTLRLLNHFGIKKPLTSYHEHNRYEKAEHLLARLRAGEDIALVSDAGTPVISDPGEVLVRRCREEGLPVTSLPGPCALITALSLSGLPARRFCFEGFLPRTKKERRQRLEALREEERTMLFYEAPHHLESTLADLEETLGDRPLTLCRELTKLHEETVTTTLSAARLRLAQEAPRGEYVLVVAGADPAEKQARKNERFAEMDMAEQVAFYEAQGLPRKEAMRQVAKDRGISRKEVYDSLLSGQNRA